MDERKSLYWKTILRFGVIGGIVAFYIAAIGMTESFSQRFLVGNILSLGHIFIFAGTVLAGVLTARSLTNESNFSIIRSGALAGVITSLFLVVLIILIQILVIPQIDQEVTFRWRDMFVTFSPGLIDLLTFGQGSVLGILILVVLNALIGGFTSSFFILPNRLSLAFINSILWVLGIGIFSENVAQIITELFGRGLVKIIFQNKALNPIAAVIIFVGAFLVAYNKVHKSAQTKWEQLPADRQKQGRMLGIVSGILLLVLLPWIVGQFLSQALFLIGLYIMMGLGLNIVVGYAGLLDLGYVAFFAFGAYVMGILTSTGPLGVSSLTFWSALPICVLAGVIWGLILGFPVLRLRGDYLAIVTLGFGEIIRILATSDWLAPIEGGPQGILHIPNPSFFGFEMSSPQTMYYLVIFGSLLIAFVTIRLRDSRLGRQWMAMREDEDVAEAMGINLVQTKLLAFAIGAAFSAMAGAFFSARVGNIFPHSFNLLWSINALSLIIVGGLGSIPGVVVGALILVGMPEILREFAEYRLLMYGILLIVMMLVRPEGFIPEATRKRELHAAEITGGSQD